MKPTSGSAESGCYLYRAILAGSHTLDFYLSPKHSLAAAKRFSTKTLRANVQAGYPGVINTDKGTLPAKAIIALKVEVGFPTKGRKMRRATHIIREHLHRVVLPESRYTRRGYPCYKDRSQSLGETPFAAHR